MAYNDITANGAIAFDWVIDLRIENGVTTAFMLSGQNFAVERGVDITMGWCAFRFHKGSTPLAINGVIDLTPYVIVWANPLDDREANGLQSILVNLNEKSQHLVQWRRGLAQAEHDALISGTFAAISGISTVAGGIAFIGDLLGGGIPWATGLWTLGSGIAFNSNLGNLEAAAIRGDQCVKHINHTMVDLIDLGRQLDLPFCTPHYTPVIQSACTGLAQAFGWKNEQLRATQAGINSWLQADLRFLPA